MAASYDPNKDYSKAIEEAKSRGEDTTQLEKEREAKIADKYGGKEPTMYGSNKTYSSMKNSSSSSDRAAINNALQVANRKSGTVQSSQISGGVNPYGGIDPYADAAYHERVGAAVNDPALEITKSKALAGQSVKIGDYTVTFNESGYVSKRVKDGGASATSAIKTTHANDSENHQLAYQAAAAGDWDKAYQYINKIPGVMNEHGEDRSAANQYAYELQNEFGYNANNYYGGLYDSVYGEGAWGGSDAVVGGGAGMQSTAPGYDSFEDFLTGTGYDQYSEATQAAIRAAVEAAVLGYQRQIETTNDDTVELARQAYINKMLGEKNLDQQMAANGYAGGMADSQRIANETAYQNELNDLEMQRQQVITELQNAIAQARLSGDLQSAQELSSYLAQVQGQWVNYVQNQQAMANQNYWNQQELNAQNQATARDYALMLLSSGTMPDYATLASAGISQTEAEAIRRQVMEQTGAVASAARRIVQPEEPVQTAPTVQKTASVGMNESYFNAFASSLAAQLSTGTTASRQAAQSNLESHWDQLSDAQKAKIIELTNRF